MPNEFFIDPTMGRQQGSLAGLGAIIGKNRERKEALVKQEQMKADLSRAFASRDPDQIAAMSAQYPQFSEMFYKQAGIESNKQKQEANAFTVDLLTSDPSRHEEIYARRAEAVRARGGDPSHTLQSLEDYRSNPAAEMKQMEIAMATANPKGYAVLKSAPPEFSNFKVADDGSIMGYNKATQQFETVPASGKVRSGTPQVQVGAGEKEWEKQRSKSGSDQLTSIQKSGQGATKQMATLNSLSRLSDDAFDGFGAKAKLGLAKLGKEIGLDIEGLSETEAYNALANSLVLDKAAQLAGALSDKDVAFLESTAPTLGNTKEGRKKIIQIGKRVAEVQKQYARDASKFGREKGYFDQIEFEDWVAEKRGNNDILSEYFGVEQEKAEVPPVTSANGGQLKVDAQGNYAYLMPDGSYQEVK